MLTGGGGGVQRLRLHRGQQLVPNHVQYRLHVFDAAGNRHHRLLLRQDQTVLPERAVAAKGIVPAAPKLETVTLIPVAFRIAAVRRLLRRRHRHPFGRQQLLSIPCAALQVKLAELRDVLCAHAQSVTAQRNALKVRVPHWMLNAERVEQTRTEKIEHGLTGDLLNDGRLHERGGGVVFEVRARQMYDSLGEK